MLLKIALFTKIQHFFKIYKITIVFFKLTTQIQNFPLSCDQILHHEYVKNYVSMLLDNLCHKNEN
ncbi:hypothetical protein BpHYR1_003897 [Brachionus plicatilis]|uniref:Uncharacterized protein n=1 Tax=Brachionus plicatilis TaxID=10195 RepID=A0A3M7PIQ9_BRAPC|nr:hypothetical protein BpHYR1_003897 [Brachionus plicatilis]